jgi:inhibitor of KinA
MKIFPLGDNALTIDFGNVISTELNDKVLNLQTVLQTNSFAGLSEITAAYASLTVFYNVQEVKKYHQPHGTVFDFVKTYIEKLLTILTFEPAKSNRIIKIPMIVNAETAPDLEFVANHANVAKTEVIRLFIEQKYRVFMLGFLPGFAYMGQVDVKIAASRKESPRQKVPKGSIGIAGTQTGIYPFDSPGGWQIIGKTDVEMFTPNAENPSFLQVGDNVQFVVVS